MQDKGEVSGVTSEGMAGAVAIMRAVYQVIVAAGKTGIPSGHLYARLMSKMDLRTYDQMISQLCRTGLVTLRSNVLRAKD